MDAWTQKQQLAIFIQPSGLVDALHAVVCPSATSSPKGCIYFNRSSIHKAERQKRKSVTRHGLNKQVLVDAPTSIRMVCRKAKARAIRVSVHRQKTWRVETSSSVEPSILLALRG